jgi:hypothetical protein
MEEENKIKDDTSNTTQDEPTQETTEGANPQDDVTPADKTESEPKEEEEVIIPKEPILKELPVRSMSEFEILEKDPTDLDRV